MFAHILVPLDGSAASEAALRQALAIARDGQRELTFVHAVDAERTVTQSSGFGYPVDPAPLIDALREDGRAILDRARASAAAEHLTAHALLVEDAPVVATTRAAVTAGADLIVMGTQGRSGIAHALLGSVTEGVLRASAIPVMTVRPPDACTLAAWPLRRVLVAVDDSEPADSAASTALAFAREARTHLTFCTVTRTGEFFSFASSYGFGPGQLLDEERHAAHELVKPLVARAEACGIVADAVFAEGRAVAEILDAAAAKEVDAIVIGSHGRRGLQRLVVGSVAEEIVRRSRIPVIVVRTPRVAPPASGLEPAPAFVVAASS